MKKRILTLVMSFFLIFTAATLSACDFNIATPAEKAMAGNVTLNSVAFQGVKIRTNTQILAVSQSDGAFTFNTATETLEVFAEKTGYTFTPKKIILTDSNTQINFTAKPIEELNGTLTLKRIDVTPTTILSMQNNDYLYNNDNKDCLKINNIEINVHNATLNLLNQTEFFAKNETKSFNISEEVVINTQTQTGITFEFKIEAYYKNVLKVDCLATQEVLSIYKIVTALNTSILNEDSTVTFEAYGYNAASHGFTYNMLFVFDYVANV